MKHLCTQVWAVHIDLVPKKTACKMGDEKKKKKKSNFRDISQTQTLSQSNGHG